MNTPEFIEYLTRRQLHLYVEGGRLRYRAANGTPSEEVLAQIRERRAELIDYLSAQARARAAAESGEPYPLTLGQEALWFLYEMERASLAYNTFYAGRLARGVDPEVLRDALRALEARHAVLRTRFDANNGSPSQRTDGEPLELGVTDVTGWQREEVERYVTTLADRPFDLEAGPVARWHLLTSEAEGDALPVPLLVLVVHHIVIDFRSLEIIFRDLTHLYHARLRGETPALPALPWTYRDYVRWSRAWPQTEAGRRARSYWLEQLSGELPVLDLPTDHPRPTHQRYEGASHTSTLSPELTARLTAFARTHLVTPNVVLLGALGLLLNRYTRQDELLVGAPMLGRNRDELNEMVGYFVNPVVLRMRFDEKPDGMSLLAQVRGLVLDALAHQDYPFPTLVEELRPSRDASRSPLFQVAFVYERESGERLETLGLFDETLAAGQRGAVFDLTLTALERGDHFRLTWEYAAALFEPATVRRMSAHFEQLLGALLERPELPVGQLPLLSEEEERQLRAWNETRAPYPADRTLVELFAAQAASTPETVAVEFGEVKLTYRELDARAGRLARRLQAAGVRPNTPVGIMLPRSAELIVAVLGVLRAGGACLPLDPEHPSERLAYVFAESGASVLLTQAELAPRLDAPEATVLHLDPHDAPLIDGDDAPPACPAKPDDLLYVLYTSGSTGRPKGVAMPHRPLVNLVAWQSAQPGLERPARVLQYTPLTFDVSFQEIATTLCRGGTLVLIEEERRRDSERLLEWLDVQRVERLFMPFVALQHLAEAAVARGGLPRTLRDVITAGEQLRVTPAVRRCFEGGRCRLHNHYGPTESHVVTALCLSEDASAWDALPPIGRPISNVEIHLLDSSLQPVPVGLSGELYVGGVALAKGYLNRPELTAERFVEHNGRGRLYRTGDLARWRADGTLEYLGRSDNQIKLRGFRVELDEIEAVLSSHPAVRETAVVVHGEGDARRLAAYVAANVQPTEANELRQSLDAHLRRHLPDYMVPASVTLLEQLPQTPSGKVDRRALPAPDEPSRVEGFVAPRDETESLLASLWSSLLGLARVGVHDNFFELGGHSLVASRLVARVRDSFGVELPLRALFDHPTVAGLASFLRDLKGAPELPALKPLPESAEPPLSFGQQRLWFLEQLEGPSAAYNMPAALELRGKLDVPALRRALLALVERHVGLRQCFPASGGQPRLKVLAPYDPLNLTDLSALDPQEREAEARRLYASHAAQPFDLAHGPLLRLHLLRLDEETHRLLFNMHHIISDGWSLGVMMRELATIYTAEAQGGDKSALPALAVQYHDYAAWQREWLTGRTLDEQLSYWREQLSGAPPLLELPSDWPRPARRSYRGGLLSQTLDAELASEVRRFNLAHGSTLFMTLLGVLDVLLWRYSGQRDLLVGTPLGNRRDSLTENLVGFFVNTLVLRTRLSADAGFDSLVAQIRQTCLDAYAHQDLPFEKLVDELQPERSFSHSPVFQVMLALQNAPLEDLRLPGLSVERLPPPLTFSKFDLTLYVEERAGELLLSWEYNADLFAPERVERMAGHFEQLLRGALARPARAVAELDMLTSAEGGRLLARQEGPRRELDWENLVVAVEEQVRRTPHAAAVVCGARSLTYEELNTRANRLARHLQRRGLRRGDKAALCLPRDIEMPAAVLAVLKAGAAYLPLDPNYPEARLRFILEDSGATLLLSHSSLRERLPESGSQVCWLDEEAETIASQPGEDLPAQAGGDDLVYVIYTSGSTGQPKGAAVFHRGFANLLQWYCRTLELTSDDRTLLVSALGFDLTQKNLFAPLLVGGSLHLPADDTYDPEAIASAVESQKITWLNCTPSTFYPVAESDDSARFKNLASLRWVVLGGEPIQSSRLRGWLDSPHCAARVLNSYGPTECTDVCVAWAFDRDSAEDPVPLGRPIDNVLLAVLDDNLRPLPEGLPGELWIGGIGLGAGYLNRAQLNSARFVEVDVFGERRAMYRSGDLVRWRADGVLEYLGRRDTQIKLRGFRIELGEIESALLELPAVREAAVTVHGNNGTQKLVAYVVAERATDALHAELERRLPDYMIPAQFVRLDSLPLTPNGKLDRDSLPEPEEAPAAASDAEPATQTEARLAELWCSLLGLAHVDRNSTFFELGGHSLLATQVIVRVHEHFGVDLPLESLFEHPTVAGLAALIDAEHDYRLPPLVPEPPDAAPVLSFAQARLWFLEQLGSGTAYNIPAAVAVTGPLDEQALRRALCHLVERHSALRLCIPEQGGQPLARLLPVYDPLTLTDLSGQADPEREAERLRAEHSATRFSLDEGPLFSLHLVRLAPERHWLLFNMHHIISDGWSMDVLIREAAELYTAYRRGHAPALPPLPIQYTDYAAWQRRSLQGAALEEQLSYWREQLTGAPVLDLPTDHPRPAVPRHEGGEVRFALDAELVERLRALGRKHDATLFMVVLAAYNLLLQRCSGQKDISVGTPVANRGHNHLENVVGLFLNTLVMRTRVPAAGTFPQLLAEVRRTTLAAYAHQDLPFEYLVEQLQPARSLSHNPLFQVLLNLVNTRNEEVRLDGLEVEHLNAPFGLLSKFDLNFTLTEAADGGLDGRVEYNAELFVAETVEFLAGRFVALLGQVAARPEAPLSELSLLDEAWRARTTQTRQPRPKGAPVSFGGIEQSLPARFAEQVRLHPARVAVRTPDASLTYAELDEAARRVAARLLALPPAPRVALLLPHDASMIVGLVGALQAGRAYVPLDPAYPFERLSYVLDDTQSPVVVCTSALRPLAERLAGSTRHVVNLDELSSTPPASELPTVSPDSLAYVLYTSGSTGQPKGVMQSQRNVLHFIRRYTENLRLTPEDRLLQVASYAFDAGVMDIFGALLNGAALYPVNLKGVALEEAAGWLAREQVTVYHSTPTVFRLFVNALRRPLPAVRLVVLGGEPVVRSDAEAFRRHFDPDALFVNGLGPTESTVTLQYFLDRETPLDRSAVPVGYPVADTEVLLLDEDGRPAELYGEMVIRSAHVALGYWRQESEAFGDDPRQPGKRLYRTGDLGRLLPDGSLEAVGRRDGQVKLRGFRVELGEVEAALRQHPSVREAAATLWRDGTAEPRLVAYVSGEADASELKEYARHRLPDYMVPAAVTVLPSLPLTVNGKLDRRNLPPPDFHTDAGAAALSDAFAVTQPGTEAEALLANLWSGVLGTTVEDMGADFFKLGGHSLLAMQLLSRIRDSFGVELPLLALFEHTVLREQAAQIQALSRPEPPPPVRPLAEGEPLPLSFAQQRLWFISQFQTAEADTYTISAALRLEGRLDVSALRIALLRLTERQQSLRMNFEARHGQPFVTLRAPYDPLNVVSLRDLSGREQDEAVRALADGHARRPFDLSADPLLRLSLVELGHDSHVLLFQMHHIVSDGWSLGVLVKELSALYTAAREGREPALAALTIQYADYAAWQRGWLAGETLEGQLAYWREQLSDAPAVLELPTARPRPAVMTYRGGRVMRRLGGELAAALKDVSRDEGATLYMTLLAAFKVMLARYSGQPDVIVGTPIANRTQSWTEELIGLFVNTLALRTRVSGRETFRSLLARVRATALGAYAHQDVPFEKLVEELQPERSLSHTPLFQVVFALQNVAGRSLELGGLPLQVLESERGMSKFDLFLAVSEHGGELFCSLEYNADLFEPATVEHMLERYETLLRGVASDAGRIVSELPLLTEGERQRLLVGWNSTATDYPRDEAVHRLFEEQAARTPNAIAVVCEDEQLTYAELNARANRLARRLRASGVGPEVLVGVLSERGAELVVAMLATLKAGGAYVPLDPSYPADRLAFMIEDARTPVLLAQRKLSNLLPACDAKVVHLDADEAAHALESADNLDGGTDGDNLAYIIYTSGSTGTPKGSAIIHRAITRLVLNTNYAALTPDDCVAQVSNASFDAATFEIWGALLNGSRLAVLPTRAPSLAELGGFLRRHQVTTLWLTAGLFHLMAEHNLDDLRGLRQLLAGGDVLSVSHVRKVAEELPECRLINGYGPTENTTFTCCHHVTSVEATAGSVPIGRPVGNTRVYVLDASGQLAPAGVVGELYAAGDGLARGYTGRAALTAERFVPDPFSAGPGARLYRTGDLCRWLPGGVLEFVGRVDEQVKLRGFRVEPGEIEAVLSAHPRVVESVVVVREDTPGERRLVAYAVAAPDATPTQAELREFLKSKLPEYMLPSAFVLLDALPLTPNGKVDRRALPEPEAGRPAPDAGHVAPRTPVEDALAGIWADVLRIERPGVYDNFFDLGGHSLLATQLMSHVRGVFGVELPLRLLFEQPTVAELARSIEARLREGVGLTVPPVRPRVRAENSPLSFAQQRLWFINQLEPESPAYHLPAAVRLTGALDRDALARTLEEVTRRHEVLRTSFPNDMGQPVQRVDADARLELRCLDLSGLAEQERETEARRLAREEAHEPFDLARGPLVRARLLRLAEEEHVLLFTMHHIVSDGWSMGVFVREVAALYEAFARGEASPLEPLPVQYADYAAWQREWLQGSALDEQLIYWRRRLEGAPPVLELPADRPRPAARTFRGARQHFEIPADLRDELTALGRREGVTLFMTLLAAWQALLARHTGQADIPVGSPIANRNREETESLIGFFVNTLVLRTDLSGDPTFRQLLARVREVCLGAYAHQDVPFEMLVEELQPERSLSHSPLFQVMFVLQNAPLGEVSLKGLRLRPLEQETDTAKFDLMLNVSERGPALSATWEYSTDLFDDPTIARLAEQFQVMLRGVVSDPDQTLSSLPLLTTDERRQLLSEFNDTATDYPRDKAVHRLFEEQAARTPDAVAVVCEDERLTYAELNARANKLARYLRERGAGLEQLVAVLMERGPEMVVALLATLKAGAAYLPLDPEYPEERLRFMLEDADARLLLTHKRLAEQLPVPRDRVIRVDEEWPQVERRAADNLEGEATGDNLAYVIYTSGSTGRPKGVSVPHRGVVRLVTETNYADFSAGQVFLQLAPISFDAATFEIWGALLNGSRLAVLPTRAPSLAELGGFLRKHEVTTLWLTAGLFHLMAEHNLEDLRGLRQLLAGGDVLSVSHVRKVVEELPECRLINGYGPTENTTFTCCHQISGEGFAGGSVPIGRPVGNTRVYVLDASGQLAPAGAAGELYIGGDGLARDYLKRPALTAERFVPDPFSAEPGARLYRTGDLCRWLPGGVLEFQGRVDNQVKLRGFRVELGEVEAALRQEQEVSEAVVIVQGEGEGRRLVAYLLETQAGGLDVAALKQSLKQRLPEYMMPAHFVVVEEMPLNANGKIDRARLPAVDDADARAGEGSRSAPLTMSEDLLAVVWCEVLKRDSVGRDDNFFELGGHSLLATQLVSRIRTVFNSQMPLSTVFSNPTLREMAAQIDADRGAKVFDAAITRADRARPLPLSFAQERLWFLSQLEPENPFYNTPLALRLSGPLQRDSLRDALQQLLARHEVLRTSFRNEGGQPRQVVLDKLVVPLIEHDLSALPEQEREDSLRDHARREARTPFRDLSQPPLVRAVLLKLGEDEHALLLTLHHIVIDGWSLGVLVRELAHFYNAYAAGEEAALPPLNIQYADFAAWQREWLKGEVLERQIDYWRNQLAGAPPMLALPTDFPRPAVQQFRGASLRFGLDRETRDALYRLGRRHDATLYMTLLSSFAVLLYRYSGQHDIVIGSPIANRQHAGLEDLLGFFVNTLTLRVDLAGRPRFSELLKRVQQVSLDAYAHQDLPFEKLVDELQPERDLSRSPLFQVMFALQNMPFEGRDLHGLKLGPLHVERDAALFDLVLDFWDTEDGLRGVLEYNCDLFTPETAERLVRHLRTLLKAFAADADLPVDSAPLLDEDETRQLLSFANGPAADYPVNESLAEAFERQAAATPLRVAAVAGQRSIDYASLNERANRAAHLLRELGVAPNMPVGVMVPRGLDYLAAVLGVVKAGGAFMPLDTAYPSERLRYMLEDGGCSVLLTTAEGLASLTPGGLPPELREVVLLSSENAERVSLPEGLRLHDAASLARQPSHSPPAANGPRDLLYMLYTSGSTGLPKGTLVRHDGALNHIYAEFRLLEFHADTAFLQSAPASSDISVWQCLAPLLAGGRVVFADFETTCSPAALFELIRDERVTLIELVPVVLEGLLSHAAALPEEERGLPRLEWAMVTGEAVSVALVNRWFRVWPRVPLVNAYGPTEAADDVCQHVMREPLSETQTNVPIGVPVDNMSVLVLDGAGQLVPVGVPGEICVGGIGVGEGYWRQPERTRAAFVPNPLRGSTFGETLYRTGDLGRWRADGSLEFMGRLDHQVKIRGFRVELGEIEAALRQHRQVREALVLDQTDARGERQLVAYLQAQADPEASDELVRQQVKLWKDLHEDSYGDTRLLAADPTFNTVGWDSTYTGEPLSAEEMRECVDNAVTRILELGPRRLLEIGCGTGLLLYRLVPRCEHYTGTDLSAVAIEQLKATQGRLSIPNLERAELREQRADDFAGFPAGSIDTVVLNSVIQYFPGVDYLLDVLSQAARRVADGGSVFLGDVRSLPLLRGYHTSVQCFKAEDTLTREELSRRVEAQLAREQELAVAPEFFHALCQQLPRLKSATLRPKRGRLHNEMTRFRYDVALRVEGTQTNAPCPADAWHDWRLERQDLEAVREYLLTAQPAYFGLRHVANARLADELRAERWLREAAPTATVRELREVLAEAPSPSLDPELLWELADELPYRVEVVVEPEGAAGEFAILFAHRDSPAVEVDLAAGPAPRPWAEYANNPLQEKLGRRLVPELRDFVKTSLPGHMIPAAFVVLDRFPLMPNGKIDREALPKPTFEAARGGHYVAPRTDTERLVESVWINVLGVDEPGVNDNFFSLGGHSLKATQVVSRLQQQGKELSLRDIFNYPTIAELAALLDRQQQGAPLEAIPATPRAEDYPVSHAQRRLWVLSQMDGSAAYHMTDGLRLRGPLDANALARAFDALLERHETLRTSFVEVEGELRQRVADSVACELESEDLSGHADPLASAREAAHAHAHLGFDLSRAPLLRVRLLRLGAADNVLLFSMHHIISDGWSMDVLARELMTLYGDAVAGRPSSLQPLRIQYRDYVAWQRERLPVQAASAREFWSERLRDLPPPLELPTDFPRPPLKTYNGGRRRLTLPADFSQTLNALARERQVSLFMLLSALVKVLLYRYSGETDISIGCPVAGRHHPDLENQIGFYINTLVLRDRLDGAQSFEDFLAQVRETATAAYEFQDYPFDRLVQDLNPPRDPSRNPLFDVMLALQNTANVALDLPELEIESLSLDFGTTQFDLLWNFAESDEGLHVELQYNSDLFTPESVGQMLARWQTLARGAAAEPSTPLGRLPLLKPAERAALLNVSPVPDALLPTHPSLAHWFEAQAAATPDAIAVTDGARQLTYDELNARANRLARRVRRQLEEAGTDGRALVGLCTERSAELVVGILGILKAGAAYVPLDPDAPAARLRFILKDARVPLLVAQAGLLDVPVEELPRLCLLEEDAETDAQDSSNLGLPLTPDATAYVIYTSGSTGEPKGALVTHGNVLRLFSTTRPWFDFNPADVWTLFHSYAFDFSVWELWGALLYGGRLVVVPYMVSRSPEQFYELLVRDGVTVLNQTPSAFRQLMQAEAARRSPAPLALRFVVFGGEALEPSSLRPWFDAHGDRRPQLVNMYGITETTVHVTYRPLTARDAEQPSSLIGEPLPDLYLYVLDEWMEPVPPGVPGELYVGGAGLSEGYLFRDELTAERFVADPFREGRRVYRTGDRVRRRADGELEYLGRLDGQVKIRGFRIEVGEVASVMSRYPGVRESAVTLRGRDGDACLVGYYVASNGDVDTASLRRHLQQHLPAYMVPLFFVPVPRLPLTVNGKLDLRALPDPAETPAAPGNGNGHGRAPRTEHERIILEAWRKALGHEQLGPDDNVFEHGAHSVVAVQVRNQLQNALLRDIPVVLLFQYPSAATLAAQLDDDDGGTPAPADEREPEPGTRAAQRREAARRRAARRPADGKREH